MLIASHASETIRGARRVVCVVCERAQTPKILMQHFVRVVVPLLESEFQLRPTITTDDDHRTRD